MKFYAGLDWGSAEHAACVVDENGKVHKRLAVTHTAEGLQRLLAQLAKLAPSDELPIAIERPDGLVVDTLVDAGHPVTPIHPNIVKACRPRYSAALGKSDPGDAYILADILRTDGHRLVPLRPQSDELKALRAAVRARTDLVHERVAVANQLRALLESFWPGAASLFHDIDSRISLAFLQRYPTPKSAGHLGERRMAAFLKAAKYSGRASAADLVVKLRAAPKGLAGPREEAAKGELVGDYVSVLLSLVGRIARQERHIEAAVAELDVGRVVMSFPRAGKVNAAQIVAELGDNHARFPSEAQLAAEAGVAPVTRASGKKHNVGFRYACNTRLRAAIATWADNSRHASPWAKDIYDRARARGCEHAHAIRILARAWVRVLWRCWRDGTAYDPTRHKACRGTLTHAHDTLASV